MPDKKQKLNVCLVSSEFTPFAKTGGLADVSSALSLYLQECGHDVRVLLPEYSRIAKGGFDIRKVEGLQDIGIKVGPWDIRYSIDAVAVPNSDLQVYLLRCPELYERDGIYTQDGDEHLRFLVLSRVAIELCQRMQFAPDILHCHDWQTALIPLLLRSIYGWDKLFSNTRTILTIHNIGYQGVFSADIQPDLELGGSTELLHQEDLEHGRVNFLKTGFLYADVLTTVSPTYAREIQGTEYGVGLDGILRSRSETLVGILNGVNYDEWDPATDPLIPHNYDPDNLAGKSLCKTGLQKELGLNVDADTPLIGIVSRLVGQKGFDLVEEVVPSLLKKWQFSLAILGNGEPQIELFFSRLQQAFPGRVCFFNGYSEKLAHWIEAGSDMFLMPSLYEPCGLNQMYSLKYGTIPIVRETGGLADSVEMIDPRKASGTGILFRDYNADGLRWAMTTALTIFDERDLWQKIMQNAMAQNFAWDTQGAKYVELYRQLSNKT